VATFGYNGETSGGALASGQTAGSLFSCGYTGKVTKITAKVYCFNEPCEAKFAIYNSSGNLLAVTEAISVTTSAAWKEANIDGTPPDVENGQSYYLVVLGNSNCCINVQWTGVDDIIGESATYPNFPNPSTLTTKTAAHLAAIYATVDQLTLKDVTDTLALSDTVHRNKSLVVTDTSGLTDAVLQNKILTTTDSVGLADVALTGKIVVLGDAVNFADSTSVNKVLQVTETIHHVETVQVGVGNVKKTKLFLLLGDLAVQLTGE